MQWHGLLKKFPMQSNPYGKVRITFFSLKFNFCRLFYLFLGMTPIQFPFQTGFYKGKVRDVYTIKEDLLVMLVSDRISAFDVILPKPIPYKGQVLNQLAAFMLERTKDVCPNWLAAVPAPNASIGYKCEPIKAEVVVRGNLCGHAWRTYLSGQRFLCGVLLPDGLAENDFFETPIITPTTKASQGHDEDISVPDILQSGLVSEMDWNQIAEYAQALFKRGKELASKQGLILADTKYEFGKRNGSIVLMDEIHTPDSSRYLYADGFDERQQRGEKQKQLSKEFVREWLIQNEFMGKEGQTVPEMTEQWVQTISEKYIELYERITGEAFVPAALSEEETYQKIVESLNKIRT
jgi:phosphoribosylaminoimidazole-succinocarboxamide synthase